MMYEKDLMSYLGDVLIMAFFSVYNWKAFNGLNPSTRLMLDASTNKALLSKSYN